MLLISFFSISSQAQIIDFVKPTTSTSSHPRLVRPLINDCNGHDVNPGVRDVLGGLTSGPNKFRTATEWINAHGGSNVISVGSNGNGFALEGNFLIDQPIVFQGADVRASPNAKITVVTSLESMGSKFYACEGLWEGIVAGGSVTGRVSLRAGTEIEDAKVGVLFSSSSRAAIVTGTIFKRNVIGIGYKGIGKPTFRFTEFNGNTFECKKPINKVPNFDDFSTSGITIVGGKLDIIGTGNLFTSKLRIGIEVVNATSNIIGCNMDSIGHTGYNENNILTGGFLGENDKGYGISARNSNVSVDECNFSMCSGGGIWTDASNVLINGSTFYFEVKTRTAAPFDLKNLCISLAESGNIIQCKNNENKTIYIQNNNITIGKEKGTAIYLDKSNKAMSLYNNHILFKHQRITMGEHNLQTGIHLKGKGYGSTIQNCTLADNTFDFVTDLGIGHTRPFFLDKTAYVYAISNIVYWQSANSIKKPVVTTAAFFVENSNNCNFYINHVSDDLSWHPTSVASADFTTAFRFEGTAAEPCQENGIYGNTVDRTDQGFVFQGDCDRSAFTCNTMKDCINRLYLISPSSINLEPKIGEQYVSTSDAYQNNFNGFPTLPKSVSGLFFDAGHDGNRPDLSKFLVDPNDSYPHNPEIVRFGSTTNTFPKTDWFNEDANVVDYACLSQRVANSSLSATDKAIIANEFSETEAVWNWENKIALYNRLFENADLRVGDASTYFDNLSNTPLAAYAATKRKINHFFDLSAELKEQINTLYAQRESKKRELDALINNKTAVYGQNWSLEAMESVADAFEEFNTIEKALFTLSGVVKQERISKAQSLKTEIAALSSNTVYEQDFKTLFNIILSAYLNDKVITSMQMTQLQAIAAKCPKVSGTNVFAAVALLSPQGTSTYDAAAACGEGQIPASGKQQHTNVTLYPNPSNESMVLNVAGIATSRTVEIWDIQGRLLTTLALPAYQEQLNIATGEMTDGIYILKVANSEGATQTEKFVVKH